MFCAIWPLRSLALTAHVLSLQRYERKHIHAKAAVKINVLAEPGIVIKSQKCRLLPGDLSSIILSPAGVLCPSEIPHRPAGC